MCEFSVPFGATPDELVKGAKAGIEGRGGSFVGDTRTGDFVIKTPVGAVKGGYTIRGSEISVKITKKPFVVTCKVIEQKFAGYLK